MIRPGDLDDNWLAAIGLARAAVQSGSAPMQSLGPLLQQALFRTQGSENAQTFPETLRRRSLALNSALCTQATEMTDLADVWLAWISAHAADYPEDRLYADQFGITAAKMGLDPDQVALAFETTANWSKQDSAALRQMASSPCPD